MATFNIDLVNNTGSDTAYAYITGQAIDNNNALFLLQSDGTTAYYPTSPSATGSALSANCAIPLGANGSTKTVTIPHLAGARLWFIRDAELTFYLNPGPELVEPSSSNTSDVNYNLYWDFCEFTWNAEQLYVNITMVDFACLPIALSLTNTSGTTTTAKGLPADGLATICSALQAQNASDGAGWDKLVVTTGGANLRANSPNTGISLDSSLFSTYWQPYVTQVWSKYAGATLSVDTQASAGTLTATVSGDTLTFSSDSITYGQPASADIFSNSSGVFAVSGDSTKDAVTARLAAAFNRSTLLIDTAQPDNEVIADYYKTSITNHYARIIHATALDGKGYAFPYDDVAPSDATNVSGAVFDGSPKSLTVTVGGPTSDSTKKSTNQGDSVPAQSGQNDQGNHGAQKKDRLAGVKKFMRKLSCKN
ncbi:CAZyme family GH64 [Penicillium lagena]|uniref:CAZyme family GH64 n=1 Tax=Penicillium lagena TaxID=94218 RepID=UPI00254163DA|nr:CAZyme family GH64 [Penicillium lagena]KAJ5610634.1 CAZyme family GH64 [Penicillium lagena]